ncbi:hypothetical protein QP020_02240 [Gallibacterium anatis]|uniref:hypothetical protein n=1 Tax=Gallibacterium anatis TaxID=750 RepID=UPI0025511673|nr:hypothetical protein [Gallibacterium anatis]WIM84872.1 hypothetical protein QP020_02240 [Gallibacterium anatis]
MRKIFILFSFLLSGCYLANGSPSSYVFWESPKNITEEEDKKIWDDCYDGAIYRLSDIQKKLFDKGSKSWEEVYENESEYKIFEEAVNLHQKYFFQCLYNSGYRFRPPLIWCLAQDGNNTRICIENMKYRN